MKRTYLRQTKLKLANGTPIALALAIAVNFSHQDATAAAVFVNLGAATDFAVLAGAGITVAGPVDSTTINGNIGSHATTSITGLENVVLNGVNHAGDGVTQQGKIDLGLAYTDAAGQTPTMIFPPISDLGGLILGTGVYQSPSSFGITGTLTLDAGGDPNAVWIFQAGSTLITGSESKVLLIAGAQASNVFWQVGSSATLGTYSHFEGSILASESISLNTGADLEGRALALTGAVTLDNNTIGLTEVTGIPEPMSVLSTLAIVAGGLLIRRRAARDL